MTYPTLTDAEIKILNRDRCPDCRHRLVEGPCGGGSINHYCGATKHCGSKFNLSVSWERISSPSPNEPPRREPQGAPDGPYR